MVLEALSVTPAAVAPALARPPKPLTCSMCLASSSLVIAAVCSLAWATVIFLSCAWS
jgi:hypothetical protein